MKYVNEDLTRESTPEHKPGSLKRKAAQYLGQVAGKKLTKSDLRKLQAKTNKMKKHEKKAERHFNHHVEQQIDVTIADEQ